jgi:hypothetical protein
MIDKDKVYLRLLELQAVISEEWGEAIKEMNDYSWKLEKNNNETLQRAYDEIQQMYSPIIELQELLQTVMKMKPKK